MQNRESAVAEISRALTMAILPEQRKALQDALKQAMEMGGQTDEGVVVIKAQTSRSLDQNKVEALQRLQALVDSVATLPKTRKATKPSFGAKQRRLEGKANRAQIKQGRGRVSGAD